MRRLRMLVGLFLLPMWLLAQNARTPADIRVFIDCNTWCDFNYIRTEINFVDFVPDAFSSNVFVQITAQQTGSGGAEVTLFYSGSQQFSGLEDTLRFNRSSIATDDEYRRQLVQFLKLGLTRYLARTNLAEAMRITSNVRPATGSTSISQRDPWDSWVMRLSLSGNLNRNDYNKYYRYSSGLEATRITAKSKLHTGLYYRKTVQEVTVDGETMAYPNVNYYGYAAATRAFSDHWSYGGSVTYEHSTFSNYESQLSVLPALEYSFLPYRDAIKKAITFYYEVGPSWNQYIDSSYYGQLNEVVVRQALSFNADFIQKWGNLSFNASWTTFLNSFENNGEKIKGMGLHNYSFGGEVEARLFKGLFINTYVGSNFTKGIFPNLRKTDFSAEDIITNVRQYPTTNSIYLSFGINYRFGSIYNNVVNPAFRRNRYF